MKIKNLFIGAIVLFAIPSTAQVFSPSHQFTIAPNVFTGIATQQPTNMLDINGDLRIRTVVQNNNLTNILGIDAAGVVQSIPSANIGGPDNDWMPLPNGNMFNLNPGNVGVGTNNPNALFHVSNTTANGSRIQIGSLEWIQDGNNALTIGGNGPLFTFQPNVDCQTDLGTANVRFNRLFACLGVFNFVPDGGGKALRNSVSLNHIRTLRVLDHGNNTQLDPAEVSAFMPEAVDYPAKRVDYDEDGNATPAKGTTSINMTALTPHIIGAILEVDNRLQECCTEKSKSSEDVYKLNDQIKHLEEEVNELKALLVDLLPKKNEIKQTRARLGQNTPNPFNSQTNIGYFIPLEAQEASIVINNAAGSQVEVIELTNRGEGGQDIEISRWSNSGVYYYSLIVDGELIGTRKMILHK